MAGSIAENANLYEKKKTFTYVPPSPPIELIESTSFTLDFTSRKFVHIGIDPSEQLQTVVLLLTSSRYVKMSIDFLRRIYSLMGNILSFILDISRTYKRTIFLETDNYKISSMVYSGSTVLVIESKTVDGCRVLLNRTDLIKLQELEWCITASIREKETNIKPKITKQMSDYSKYLSEKCLQADSPPTDLRGMENFVRNMEVMHSIGTPHIGQIKMYATTQLAELCMAHRNVQNSEVPYDKNFKSLSDMSPSYSMINETFSKLEESCDGFNQTDDDDILANLQCGGYSPISPSYSPGSNISKIQEVATTSILAKSIDENDGSSSSLPPHTSDEYELNAQYPPWYMPPRYIQPLSMSFAVDENDGPTVFIKSPPQSPSFLDKPVVNIPTKRKAHHLTPLHGVKRC